MMKQRLNADRQLQPLLARFVPHTVQMTKQAEMQELANKFRLQQLAAPMLVIASADGKLLDVALGVPEGDALPKFIAAGLAKSQDAKQIGNDKTSDDKTDGKKPGSKTDDNPTENNVAADARRARQLVQQKKHPEAIALVLPHLDSNNRTIRAVVSSLNSSAGRMLNNALRRLKKQGSEQFKGALEIVRLRRIYGELPQLSERLDAAHEKLQATDGLLEQVVAVDRGRAAEEAGNQPEAITAYRQVVEQYPDSLAAKACQSRLKQLNGSK